MISPRFERLLMATMTLGICVSCSSFMEPIDAIADGQVRVTLSVTPGVLTGPGTVLAVLTYENLGSERTVVTSSNGCLSFASAHRGETRVPFSATDYACLAVVRHFEIEAGGTLTMEWPLTFGAGSSDGAPPGTYRFVANLLTHDADLGVTFVVR